MSNTILEMIRSKNEEIEHLEKALTKSIAYKENNPKEKVFAEYMIQKFLNEIQKRCREQIELFEDKENLKKEEIDILAGNKNFLESSLALITNNTYNSTRTPDVWHNFYEKVKEVKFINRKILNNNDFTEIINYEKMFNSALDEVNNKAIFTAEENKGKCVDMHEIYLKFMNLKKIKEGDYLHISDYLTFLSEFYKFENIPINLKKNSNYREYIDFIYKYIKNFFQKSNPMININIIFDSIDEDFETAWKNGNIPGWTDFLKQLRTVQNIAECQEGDLTEENLSEKNQINPLFCMICGKLFTNSTVLEFHKKGKNHLKNLKNLEKSENSQNITEQNVEGNYHNKNSNNIEIQEKIREINENKEEEIRSIAYFEFCINKLVENLSEIIENTKNTIRKKQSRNYDEIEAEQEDAKDTDVNVEDDEDEKPVYNPKNVPLGWDGKPIPYWLYKLHGLGIEYKCEVCGGASYWGRRAFERHFQEWRHSYGMKCLKIPNTVHFKEVTGIEDALRLHQALLESQKKKSFRPELDEEFEDTEGNVVNKKMFIDLKRQGLL